MREPPLRHGRTEARRIELYQDRWSLLWGDESGLVDLSDMLSTEELGRLELFSDYDEKFLEKLRPDVSVATWEPGAVLFEEGSYIDLAFFIESGEVEIFLEGVDGGEARPRPIFDLSRTMIDPALPDTPPGGPRSTKRATELAKRAPGQITFLATMDFDLPRGSSWRLGPGELFGEIGALSGWPQSVTARTVSECRLVQVRVPALRLMRRKSKVLKERLDAIYRERALAHQLGRTPLRSGCNPMVLEALKEQVELVSCAPDELLVTEGEPAEALYLVRSGFVKLLQRVGEGEVAVSYLSKGMTLGETELLLDAEHRWRCSAQSVEYSELVKIPAPAVETLRRLDSRIEDHLAETAVARLKEAGKSRRNVASAEFLQVALDTGLVQGNSVLAIDLDVCTRCDDCVRACAATHDDLPRFVREGNKYHNISIGKSCYHCRDPVCLVGCPTGAISRSGLDQVVEITDEICIGCSVCARNCPYDAIVMHDTGTVWPDDTIPTGLRGKDRLLASKCDLCHDTGHGPACVENCPQGCAYRVGSLDEFEELIRRRGARESARQRSTPERVWLAAFLLALLATAVAGLANVALSELAPGNVWGLTYGTAAALLMVAAALVGARRRTMRLSTRLGLGSSRSWLLLHVYGGSLFLLLVLLHSGFRLPRDWLTGWLWALSLVTVASGLAGLALQRWIPRVLSSGLGVEVVYERIPELVEELRARTEKLAAAAEEPLHDFYRRKLASSFERPVRRWVFLLDITGGIRSRLREFRYLRDLLSADGREQLAELERSFRAKLELDAHYTLQLALRWWIYTHAPVSLLLVGFLALHLYVVFTY